MANQQLPTRTAIQVLFGALLAGAALIALLGIFLPLYVDFGADMNLIVHVVLLAVAVLSVGQAFWLRARLIKQLPPEEKKTSTIQRR